MSLKHAAAAAHERRSEQARRDKPKPPGDVPEVLTDDPDFADWCARGSLRDLHRDTLNRKEQ